MRKIKNNIIIIINKYLITSAVCLLYGAVN